MNARLMLLGLGLLALAAACGPAPAATSVPAATIAAAYPRSGPQTVVVTAPPYAGRAPTAAPAAATAVPYAGRAATPAGTPFLPAPTYVPPAATYAPYATPVPPPTAAPTVELPNAETYASLPVNPYVDTYSDHLSTFALDVDTASYTVARRYVMDGSLPPPEAVRVEEFVNYFRQDYTPPPDVAFALYADGAPSPFEPGTVILRFGVQGYQVPDDQRAPAALTFVIDVSGSMAEGGRLEIVKQALEVLASRLRPSDTVAIVAYTTDARVVLPPTSGADSGRIIAAIQTLRPDATTNVDAGLTLGYQLATQAFRPGGINRVILASDGVANTGITNPDAILDKVRGYAKEGGITLTAIGVGRGNFNDALLEQLADRGDGNYAYVDTPDQARQLFVNDLAGALQVIARDGKIQVDFNPETVARYRLIGFENRAVADADFRNDAVDGGELNAGHNVTALYAVQLRPGIAGRVATMQLRWQDAQTRAVREINGNVSTWDMAGAFEQASPRYQLDVLVAQYAEVLRMSPWGRETSLSDIAQRAQRLLPLLEDADAVEFVQLVQRARTLRGW